MAISGWSSHSTVENRGGAADSEHIERLDIAYGVVSEIAVYTIIGTSGQAAQGCEWGHQARHNRKADTPDRLLEYILPMKKRFDEEVCASPTHNGETTVSVIYLAKEVALGDTSPPTADPPEWWQTTKITSFEEFITMAKDAAPGSRVHILLRGETYAFEVSESRR